MKKKNNILQKLLPPLIILVVIIVALEIIIRVFNIPPTILPLPSAIGAALVEYFPTLLWSHFFQTLGALLLGVLIGLPIAIVVAAVVSQFWVLEKALSPYIILLVTTPMVTLVPLLMLIFGYGFEVRVLCVVVQVIPVVTLNSLTGFSRVEQGKRELMNAIGANRLQSFTKCVFPNALPEVFTGLRLGGIFGTIASITAEMNGFGSGIGHRVVYYSKLIETDIVFACIVLVALIGLVMYGLTVLLENKIVIWKS